MKRPTEIRIPIAETCRGIRDELDEAKIIGMVMEFGYNMFDMGAAIIKARRQIDKLQRDLDEAVGYRLATAEETIGNQDRERD